MGNATALTDTIDGTKASFSNPGTFQRAEGGFSFTSQREVASKEKCQGERVDYLVFEDEGHDVLKYANRVTCYTAIAQFFKTSL
jgi:hypothetical protein